MMTNGGANITGYRVSHEEIGAHSYRGGRGSCFSKKAKKALRIWEK